MKKTNCSFCKPSKRYNRLLIKEGALWRVELRDQQNYLGWSFIILKRHIEDLSEINGREWLELHKLLNQLSRAIKTAFEPEKFNYASFGNEINHVHVQVVPRYKHSIKLKEVVFKDERWGSNYSPYDKEFKVSKLVQKTIIDKIHNAL